MSRKHHHPLRQGFINLAILGGLFIGLGTGCHTWHWGAHHPAPPPAPATVTAAPTRNLEVIPTPSRISPPPVVAPEHFVTRTFCSFIGLTNFTGFTLTNDDHGQAVLLSPVIKAVLPWDQLIVSWNAAARPGSMLKVEASAVFPDHPSAFYTLGLWTPVSRNIKRTSVPGQKNDDGRVDTDTLVLFRPADSVQLRLTFAGGKNGAAPVLKFIGLSFADTRLPSLPRTPNLNAWGKSLDVPENSQHGYPDENGWCSPACVSMVMADWSMSKIRPDLLHTVPFVADRVYDDAYQGTGNWPFNTAFAGSYPGMRAYVTRLDSLAEVEDWIVASIPVILSARWDWLVPGRLPDSEGHLIVCIGFTNDGDVIVNDPSAHLDRGEPIRRVYKRADVIHAWTKSHNVVYLIYPETAKIPANTYGHWEGQ